MMVVVMMMVWCWCGVVDDDDCVGGDDDYSQFFQTLGVKKKRILVLAMLGLQLLQSAESL